MCFDGTLNCRFSNSRIAKESAKVLPHMVMGKSGFAAARFEKV
jgi:hypothetical protein